MKQITNIRKTVCTMANKLKKQGYSLSQAFRKAWKRVKVSIKIRAVGTTSENIQERLKFMKQFPVETMQAELVRDPENQFDKNAIQIVVHLRSINRKTVIGYVPRELDRYREFQNKHECATLMLRNVKVPERNE